MPCGPVAKRDFAVSRVEEPELVQERLGRVDDWPIQTDHVDRFGGREGEGGHEVCGGDGRGPTHAGLAVDQNAAGLGRGELADKGFARTFFDGRVDRGGWSREGAFPFAKGLADPGDAGGEVGEDVGIWGIVYLQSEDGEMRGEAKAGSEERDDVGL